MADFAQAIKWMKEGKKVRRPKWDREYYYKSHNGYDFYACDTAKFIIFRFEEFEATDWEVRGEEKSLSDKEWSGICFKNQGDPGYTREDVRSSIQKLKYRLPIKYSDTVDGQIIDIHKIIDEIFGEKLI